MAILTDTETVPRVCPPLAVSPFSQNHLVRSILVALCDGIKKEQVSFNKGFPLIQIVTKI